MFKMSIHVVVLNYSVHVHPYMKETTVTQLLCHTQSMFSTHCIAHFAVLSSKMVFV